MVGARKIRPVVEKVMRDIPQSRDSYKLLVKEVYEEYGLFLNEEQIEILLNKCPSTESITRAARFIWQDGKYLPTKETQVRRQREEINYVNEAIASKQIEWRGNTAYVK